MGTGKSILNGSGAPSSSSLLTSFGFHSVVLVVLLLVPAEVWRRVPPPKKPTDIVFYHPPEVAIPVPAKLLPAPKGPAAGPRPGAPAPAAKPKPTAPPGPDGPGKPDLPNGPEEGTPVQAPPLPQQRVGNLGILALKDKFASLAKDRVAPRLGADAKYGAADDTGRPSTAGLLTTSNPGSSSGINSAKLSHSLGGGGGGGGGGGNGSGGGGGIPGLPVGRATSSIAGIGGGDRPLAHGGPGPSRTDEEIQIVFDRYKAQFYRLYNRALRNDPTLKGQMVLRLTIEPDGSVSMCKLQSSDMNAPELAEQVVNITRTINFGAKEGVQALTISYPIDFLPAE
jgi:uncharacterized membrane protein YgcG